MTTGRISEVVRGRHRDDAVGARPVDRAVARGLQVGPVDDDPDRLDAVLLHERALARDVGDALVDEGAVGHHAHEALRDLTGSGLRARSEQQRDEDGEQKCGHEGGTVACPPMTGAAGPRVALVHDFLLDLRGAERVFARALRPVPRGRRVHGGLRRGAGRRAASRTGRQHVLPAAAAADREHVPRRCCRSTRTRWSRSTSAATTSSSRPRAPGRTASSSTTDAVHVCYCHNPFRYAWNAREPTLAARSRVTGPGRAVGVFQPLAPVGLDRGPARGRYVANSETTRRRIERYFGRDATVLHPPVETDRFAPGPLGRRLPGALRAHVPQAHRGGGARPSTALRPAARRRRRRPRGAAAAAPRRADGALRGPASTTARSRRAARAPRARGHRDGGVRDRRRRGAGRRPARHRAGRRRRARDASSRARPARSSSAPTRMPSQRPSWRSTTARSTRRPASRTPSASTSRASARGSREVVADARHAPRQHAAGARRPRAQRAAAARRPG